jgi:hypothetical protein
LGLMSRFRSVADSLSFAHLCYIASRERLSSRRKRAPRSGDKLVARANPIKVASQLPRQRLRSAIVHDTRGFASLRCEWDELYRSCPSATPFSSWEWLYSWWEHYGEGNYELRLITLRDHKSGLLVGLLPLMVGRWTSFGRLLLLGGNRITPYKDILIREGWEEPVAQAAARVLKEAGGWWVADLQELMPQSAAWAILPKWEGLKLSVPIADYILIHADSWDGLLVSLSKKARKTARRTLRQADRDGVRREGAAPEDTGRAARTLIELHREMFRGRRIDPEDLTSRYEAFMEAAARRMSARGIGRISEFRHQDGEVLVSQFLVFDKDFVGTYVIGASEEASRRYQFTTLYVWDAMNVACSKNNTYVSLMDYAPRDKLRWATEMVRSQRMILGRTKALWTPYAGYYVLRDHYRTLHDRYLALRTEAQVYVHSQEAPRWIRGATRGYYEVVNYVHSDEAPRWVRRATERYYTLRGKYGYGWLRYKYELARARRADK